MRIVHPARLLLFCLPVWLAAVRAAAQVPLGDVSSSDATVKGSVVLSAGGTRVMSGASVNAGLSNASIRLVRGGELRVCQGSSVSISSSASGKQIMVSMSSGTLETHYPVADARDSIVTPDFEIHLNGPGLFHLAVSTDERGNTCVQSQHGSNGTVTVSELTGEGSYTMLPGEEVMFRAGKVSGRGQVAGSCGCPPALPIQRAEAPSRPASAVAAAPVAPPPPIAPLIASSPTIGRETTTALPPEQPGSVHVEVEAPFVFRASNPKAPDVAAAPIELAHIRLSELPSFPAPSVQTMLPPAGEGAEITHAKVKRKKHGIWGFLASIFRG
jgi:hypothetical protein